MSAMPFLHLGDETVPSHTVKSLIDYYNWYYARINQVPLTIIPPPAPPLPPTLPAPAIAAAGGGGEEEEEEEEEGKTDNDDNDVDVDGGDDNDDNDDDDHDNDEVAKTSDLDAATPTTEIITESTEFEMKRHTRIVSFSVMSFLICIFFYASFITINIPVFEIEEKLGALKGHFQTTSFDAFYGPCYESEAWIDR